MIVALWHRWFDAREYRRALGVAEQNYARALTREAELRAENRKLRRVNARLALLAVRCAESHGPGSTSPEPGPATEGGV